MNLQELLTAGVKYGPMGDEMIVADLKRAERSVDPHYIEYIWDVCRHPVRFAVEWYRCGFPRVTIGHKHAASLMATRVPSDIAETLRSPWPAFIVDIPDGLLVHAGPIFKASPLRHEAIFTSTEDDGATIMCDRLPREASPFMAPSPVIDFLKWSEDAADELPDQSARINARAGVMLGRMLLGVLLELNEHRAAIAHASGPCDVKRDPRGHPVTRTFRLVRDVKVDARETVRGYCVNGFRTPPTVQSLVRGHWKNQPHGAASSQRKYIFVEPYWRGPEDAPIAVRSHDLG